MSTYEVKDPSEWRPGDVATMEERSTGSTLNGKIISGYGEGLCVAGFGQVIRHGAGAMPGFAIKVWRTVDDIPEPTGLGRCAVTADLSAALDRIEGRDRKAQIDRDEELADNASGPHWRPRLYFGVYQVIDVDDNDTPVAHTFEMDTDVDHIARWDPARVMKECETRRQDDADLRRLAAVLRAMLGAHVPINDSYRALCRAGDGRHPCATVQAATKAWEDGR